MSKLNNLLMVVAYNNFDERELDSNELLNILEEFDENDLCELQSMMMMIEMMDNVFKRDNNSSLLLETNKLFEKL